MTCLGASLTTGVSLESSLSKSYGGGCGGGGSGGGGGRATKFPISVHVRLLIFATLASLVLYFCLFFARVFFGFLEERRQALPNPV